MTAEDTLSLEAALLELLSQDFANVRLLRVNVNEDEDFDGDEILRVNVIFDGEPKDLEAGALSGAIGRIRSALSSKNVFRFPVTSFISAKDAKLLVSA